MSQLEVIGVQALRAQGETLATIQTLSKRAPLTIQNALNKPISIPLRVASQEDVKREISTVWQDATIKAIDEKIGFCLGAMTKEKIQDNSGPAIATMFGILIDKRQILNGKTGNSNNQLANLVINITR